AINRPSPITPSYFSYKIDRPYQQVKHELFKVATFLKLKNENRIELLFARQHNVRSEYDYLPLTGQTTPELYLSLVTHSLDLIYKHNIYKNVSGTIGFNGTTQGNVRRYQLLIPNFRNYGAGIFIMEKWTKKRVTVEAGIRYDYRWLRAYTLDYTTAKEITPTFQFKNFTETIGALYHLNENMSWNINIGTAWRAPTVNELLSNGVHQSAVAYEIGNTNLKSERAYNFSTSLNYQGKKLTGEIGFYNNSINGYIYLKPDLTFIHTVRGAYPAFTYTQVNAVFRGVDFSTTYKITNALSFTSKLSLLFARNTTIHDYLIWVPANRLENTVKYIIGDKGKVKQAYISFSSLSVAKQTRVPANSDYAPPPKGYVLLNADIGFSIPVKNQQVSISMSATNILNIAYRDYMDRFRYFNDEPGRNFTLRLKIPFEILKQNNGK
ncbi:MAG TPA: TonB-dependent receptor, partial [Cytophagaceae bacterium]|nr:TonB-dependent receptor [Cytophagaceae bacterium]